MNTGFDLAQQAAQLAADHADRVHDGWSDMALRAFREYAETHEMFATEDVIAASPQVPSAPDARAWGHIVRKAKREGMIVKSDRTRPTKHAHAHGRDVKVWRSNIYEAVAA
jgi:hypothetical protein